MITFKIVLPCLFLMLITIPIYGKGWHGITPLHSTRADVEGLLGRPEEPDKKHVSVHKLEKEVVSIIYATGLPCGEDTPNGWRVPSGTVVSITVAPRTAMRLSDLKLDKNKYKQMDGGHLRDVAYYINDEEGVKVEVIQDKVASITYFPAEEDNHLICSGGQQKPPERSSGELITKEKERLDCFMRRLKQEPKATGWIRIDLERRRLDEPSLIDLVMQYLRSKYRAEWDRVSLTGAYRLAQEMEVFIVPRNGDPIPFPDKSSKSKRSKQRLAT